MRPGLCCYGRAAAGRVAAGRRRALTTPLSCAAPRSPQLAPVGVGGDSARLDGACGRPADAGRFDVWWRRRRGHLTSCVIHVDISIIGVVGSRSSADVTPASAAY